MCFGIRLTAFSWRYNGMCALPEVWQKHQRAPQQWQVSELCLLLRNWDQRQHQFWDSWLIWSAAGLLMVKNPAGKKKKKHISWHTGGNKGGIIMIFLCIWPCGLSSEEQWVGFKSHGAVCGGWGFGKDQADQHIKARVAGVRIATAEQAGNKA